MLAINETKLDDTIADGFCIEGYDLHRNDGDGHGGGAAVYVRSSIKHYRRISIPERAPEFSELKLRL